jgi:hypothetical protein
VLDNGVIWGSPIRVTYNDNDLIVPGLHPDKSEGVFIEPNFEPSIRTLTTPSNVETNRKAGAISEKGRADIIIYKNIIFLKKIIILVDIF